MRQLKIIGLLFYLIYLASVGTLQGQNENYLLADYELSISGTSTLHDWECSVNEVDATVVFSYAHQRISGIESLRVTITSESIKSGKKAMDKKLYEALKTDRYPNITFKLTELNEFNENGPIRARGNLTIAGVTREVTISAHADSQHLGTVIFSGSKTLDLLDYDIEPPVALFGTIRTGNEITIDFKMTLNTKANLL